MFKQGIFPLNKLFYVKEAMKYHISKENIEFYVLDSEVAPLVTAIVSLLVPSKIKKLYFNGLPSHDYSELEALKASGLTMLSQQNYDVLVRKQRLVHQDGYLAFVPVLSGIVKASEWRPICEQVIRHAQKNV